MACFAQGTTIIRNAAELKVKESNRIDVMVENLSAMGAQITATDDGMIIKGGYPLHGAVIDSHLDHRIAMSFAIAGLNADGETTIQGAECVNISYPQFYQDLINMASPKEKKR
jgi:3-phosphoshikimate 1-carboxyvinyltransferase